MRYPIRTGSLRNLALIGTVAVLVRIETLLKVHCKSELMPDESILCGPHVASVGCLRRPRSNTGVNTDGGTVPTV